MTNEIQKVYKAMAKVYFHDEEYFVITYVDSIYIVQNKDAEVYFEIKVNEYDEIIEVYFSYKAQRKLCINHIVMRKISYLLKDMEDFNIRQHE